MTTCGTAQAAPITALEKTLRQAMIPSGDEGIRIVSSGALIIAYINKGFVARKPDQRADYVDYRRVRKPATLFGHKLVVLEEEYLTEFIGCCVNNGLGIVVEKTGSLAELEAFAIANECAIHEPSDATYSLKLAGVKPKRGATYVSISCKEKDLVN
jgi:hypothetical protein